MFELKGDIYIEGYWQTEKYFKNIEHTIKKDFTFKTKPDKNNQSLLNQIKNCNAVAIHVRRGDYVKNPVANRILGVCNLDYYNKCINLIIRKINNPHFFIFSDDPKWTINNLNIDFPATYVSHNGSDKGYEDLRLMSNCKHQIIANSSFSWWGAWLNNNPNKVVMAPKKWFNDLSINTEDLIPESWVKI